MILIPPAAAAPQAVPVSPPIVVSTGAPQRADGRSVLAASERQPLGNPTGQNPCELHPSGLNPGGLNPCGVLRPGDAEVQVHRDLGPSDFRVDGVQTAEEAACRNSDADVMARIQAADVARVQVGGRAEPQWQHKKRRPGGVLDCWSRAKLI